MSARLALSDAETIAEIADVVADPLDELSIAQSQALLYNTSHHPPMASDSLRSRPHGDPLQLRVLCELVVLLVRLAPAMTAVYKIRRCRPHPDRQLPASSPASPASST